MMCSLIGGATILAAAACETTDPTEAVVANDLPGEYTIVKVWYRSTLFLAPIPPGAESDTLRVGTGTEPAYALLAHGGSSSNADAGTTLLVPARTRDAVTVSPGEKTRIVFSPETAFVGCGGPSGLTAADYAFLAERIFPGDSPVPFAESGCSAPSSADAAVE